MLMRPPSNPIIANLEAFTFFAEAVRHRHAAILEEYLAPLAGFPAELAFLAAERKSGGALFDNRQEMPAGPAPPVRTMQA